MTMGTEGTYNPPPFKAFWGAAKISAFRFTPYLGYGLWSVPLGVILKGKVLGNLFFPYFSTIQAMKCPNIIKLKHHRPQMGISIPWNWVLVELAAILRRNQSCWVLPKCTQMLLTPIPATRKVEAGAAGESEVTHTSSRARRRFGINFRTSFN